MSLDRRFGMLELLRTPADAGGERGFETNRAATLTRLRAAVSMEAAALVFLENPAAFTEDSVADVPSSTGITDEFFEIYCNKIMEHDSLEDERFVLLEESMAPKPPKNGIGPDGKPFVRKRPVPRATMQTLQILFPEIADILFTRLDENNFELPAEWTWFQIRIVSSVFLSCDVSHDKNLLEVFLEDEEITIEDLESLSAWLVCVGGKTVQPLLSEYVGETDLAANVINSFKGKIDTYLMSA